jgi:homospermidine synthase
VAWFVYDEDQSETIFASTPKEAEQAHDEWLLEMASSGIAPASSGWGESEKILSPMMMEFINGIRRGMGL